MSDRLFVLLVSTATRFLISATGRAWGPTRCSHICGQLPHIGYHHCISDRRSGSEGAQCVQCSRKQCCSIDGKHVATALAGPFRPLATAEWHNRASATAATGRRATHERPVRTDRWYCQIWSSFTRRRLEVGTISAEQRPLSPHADLSRKREELARNLWHCGH